MDRIIFLTLAVAILLAPSVGYARFDEDLVLHYSFDEIKGDAVRTIPRIKMMALSKETRKW